jgi:hypothetical protein
VRTPRLRFWLLFLAAALAAFPFQPSAQTYSGKMTREQEEGVACAELAGRLMGGAIQIEDEANSLKLCSRSRPDCKGVKKLYELKQQNSDGLTCPPEPKAE